MLSLNQLKIFLLTMGILLACMSGYFSVVGLSHLFGNGIEIWIMASLLELSKIVSVSFISNKLFITVKKTIRIYILSSTILLMLITSLGVYGYLSSKYQEIDNKINEITLEKNKFILQIEGYKNNILMLENENVRINKQIENLQTTQNNSNSLTGQVINNKNYNKLLNNLNKNNTKINNEINNFNIQLKENLNKITINQDSVQSIQKQISNLEIKENKNSDISSLKFISKIFNIQYNFIINVLIIILVLVFDPLAISLLISANLLKEEKKLEGKLGNYTFLS